MHEMKLIYATRPGVLHPDGRAVAVKGEAVVWSSWWARRLRDGEIALAAAEAANSAKTKREREAQP